MNKWDKSKPQADAPKPGIMDLEAALVWVIETKGTLQACRQKNPETYLAREGDIKACDTIMDILTALKSEGIQDGEEVRDLIHDYNALAAQYRAMHQKYEEPEKVQRLGLGPAYICPKCNRQVRPGNSYCWNCGKPLGWGR